LTKWRKKTNNKLNNKILT